MQNYAVLVRSVLETVGDHVRLSGWIRWGRSTVDSVGYFGVTGVSLDIVIAFDTTPGRQLELYFRVVVEAYLRDRTVKFIGRNGVENRREVCCGILQGSIC